MAGAAFGDVGVSVSLAGATLFVARAALGDLGASVFVAGAAFGEILRNSRSAKRCIFQYKIRFQSTKSNFGKRAGAR